MPLSVLMGPVTFLSRHDRREHATLIKDGAGGGKLSRDLMCFFSKSWTVRTLAMTQRHGRTRHSPHDAIEFLKETIEGSDAHHYDSCRSKRKHYHLGRVNCKHIKQAHRRLSFSRKQTWYQMPFPSHRIPPPAESCGRSTGPTTVDMKNRGGVVLYQHIHAQVSYTSTRTQHFSISSPTRAVA